MQDKNMKEETQSTQPKKQYVSPKVSEQPVIARTVLMAVGLAMLGGVLGLAATAASTSASQELLGSGDLLQVSSLPDMEDASQKVAKDA